jgi:hypothetical protein
MQPSAHTLFPLSESQHEFGEAAFSPFMLDLHPTTLQRWSDICKRPAFGEAVKKIASAHSSDEHIDLPQVQDGDRWQLEEQVGFVLEKIFNVAFSAMEMLYMLITKAITDTGVQLAKLCIMKSGRPRLQHHLRTAYLSGDTLATISRALEYIEHLEISIYARQDAYNIGSLGRVLTSTSGLTHLDISFAGHAPCWARDRDNAVAGLTQSLLDVHIPRMSFLAMRNVTIDEAVLRSTLRAHQFTLRSFTLGCIYVDQGHLNSVLALLLKYISCLEELHLQDKWVVANNSMLVCSLYSRIPFLGQSSVLDGLRHLLHRG